MTYRTLLFRSKHLAFAAAFLLSACGDDQASSGSTTCARAVAELREVRLDAKTRATDVATRAVERAVRCGAFRAVDRAGVQALMGKPDGETQRNWMYLLGPEQGPFGVDDNWLFVEFGPGGRVTKAQVAGG